MKYHSLSDLKAKPTLMYFIMLIKFQFSTHVGMCTKHWLDFDFWRSDKEAVNERMAARRHWPMPFTTTLPVGYSGHIIMIIITAVVMMNPTVSPVIAKAAWLLPSSVSSSTSPVMSAQDGLGNRPPARRSALTNGYLLLFFCF